MSRPLLSALGEGLDLALAKPKSSGAIALLGLLSAILAALANPITGAVAVAAVFVAGAGIFLYALRQRTLFGGPYEVLDDETIWDIDDSRVAIMTKNLRVRFSYRTLVVIEHAWGGGDQFADYEAEHGHTLARKRDGNDEYVVVWLDVAGERGEERRLVSRRKVENSFADPARGWVELRVINPGHRKTLVVRFPEGAPPRQVVYKRRSDGRQHEADESCLKMEGRCAVFRWTEQVPITGDTLVVNWTW